jgi:uncharacterized protein YdhG (YjbR/CyaY superfamily)
MADTAKTTSRSDTSNTGLTADEKAAMKARVAELKAEARAGKDRAAGEEALQAALAAMPDADRVMGERIHAIVTATAPELLPKTWYGMPAYAKDGKVLCFFQAADKFKARYATFGFDESAKLDDGEMWPTSWALKTLTVADEARIEALVKKAVGP